MRTLPAALVTALLVATSPAQEPEPGPTGAMRHGASTIDMDFRGGSLTEFVAALRQGHPRCNILMREGADRVSVPELSVREATLEALLKAVAEIASTGDVGVRMRTYASRGAEPIYAIQVEVREAKPPRQPAPPPQHLEVLSLAGLIRSGLKVETLLTAVDTGLEISPAGAAGSQIRYHRESSLLFVRGSRDQVVVVRQVVAALENAAPPPADRPAVPRQGQQAVDPAVDPAEEPPAVGGQQAAPTRRR